MRPGNRSRPLRGGLAGLASLALLAAACDRAPAEPEWLVATRALPPLEALALAHDRDQAGERLWAGLAAVEALRRGQHPAWALETARRLTAEMPEEERVWRQRYDLGLELRLDRDALAAGERLLVWSSDAPDLLRRVGVLELRVGQAARAVERLTRATRADATRASTWYALGRAREAAGQGAEALAAYARAGETAAGHAASRWRRARLLVESGQEEAGRRELELLQMTGRLPPAGLYVLGTALLREGNREQGERLLTSYRALRDSHAAARNQAVLQRNRLAEIVARLRRGDAAGARRGLDDLRRQQALGAALDPLEIAAWAADGGWPIAAELALRLARSQPLEWRLRYLAGLALQRSQRTAAAAAEVEAALALDPLSLRARRLALRLAEPGGEVAARLRREVALLATYATAAELEERDDARLALEIAATLLPPAPPVGPDPEVEEIPLD